MRGDAVSRVLAVVLLTGCGGESTPPPETRSPRERSPHELAPPELRQPENGARTGSAQVRADAPIASHPLRPRFLWAPVDGADEYRIQVDDSCEVASYRSCELPSPELDVRVEGAPAPAGDGLVHTPSAPLAVASAAPVGRRYYWRVSACTSERCGPWSAVRYLDVGQLESDYDADGYGDVVIGAPMHDLGSRGAVTDAGSVFVYYGSANGTPRMCGEDARCARIDGPGPQAHGRFGSSVVSGGDIDGDGYADLVIGAPGRDAIDEDDPRTAQEGNVFVYYGGPDGLDVDCAPDSGGRCARLDNPDDQIDGAFGSSVASAGDVNADGYADVVVGAPFQHAGRAEAVAWNSGAAFVYYGGAGGVATECVEAGRCARIEHPDAAPGAEIGAAVGGGGDLDADGYADVVVGSSSGVVLVLYGAMRGVDTSCRPGASDACARIDRSHGRFGTSVAIVGDVDADGYAELLVGAFRQGGSERMVFEGSALLYRGSATGIAPDCDADAGSSACARIDNPDDTGSAPSGRRRRTGYVFFGTSVAGAGDVDGDGHADVLVGAYRHPRFGSGGFTNAVLFYGAPGGLLSRPCPSHGCDLVRFDDAARPHGGINIGSVAKADVDGDGYADVVVGTPFSFQYAGDAIVYSGGASGPAGQCVPRGEDEADELAAEAPSGEDEGCVRLPDPTPQRDALFGAVAG